MDDAVLKKITLMKVQVVQLNFPTDFGLWHIALRRLVKGYGMGDALLFSIPADRYESYKQRTAKLERMKEEDVPSSSPLSGEEPPLSGEDEAGSGMVASDVDDDPYKR